MAVPSDIARAYRAAGDWTGETLPARAAAVARTRPGALAVIDGRTRLTFAAAADLVERTAAGLCARGVRAGDVVSWQLPNWWEAAVIHHACLRAGAVPNPLNPALRAREMRFILGEAAPSLLVVPKEWRGFDHRTLGEELRDAGLARDLCVVRGDAGAPNAFERLLDTARDPAPQPGAADDAPALLLYTSGTTGDPKGVVHTHRSLLCELDSFRAIHSLTADDRYLGGAPVGHIAGLVYGVLAPFATGTSTVLLDRWDPGEARAAIERERATFMTGPPTFLQTLAEGDGDTASFRLFSTGGASIPTERVREAGARLGCTIKRAYGSTELPTLTATTLDDDERDRLETDGRAIGRAEVRIAGPDGTPLPPGTVGEIWGRAPEMFAGYRNASLGAFEPGGWFRTGDLGALDDRGLLRVAGRMKDIIIRGGENISAKEVEDLILGHPSVADVAVVGLPDERLGERACAFVVPRPGATLSLAELVSFLRAREIATHKLPERLEMVSEMPRTASGKVRKDDLRTSLA